MSCSKHSQPNCEQCVKEEIAELENKLKELKKKLPAVPYRAQCCYHHGVYYYCTCYCHGVTYTKTDCTTGTSFRNNVELNGEF